MDDKICIRKKELINALKREKAMAIISRNKAVFRENIEEQEGTMNVIDTLMTIIEEDIPTIKAEEIRYGEWIHNEGYDKRDNFYTCSLCGRTINIICGDRLENYPYCHCGAKMTGEEK